MSLKSDLKSTLMVILLFSTLGLISFVLSPKQTQGPHGGTLKKAGGYFIEIKNFEKILSVYLLDQKLKPVKIKGITGEVKLIFADNTDMTIPLKNTEERFTCKLPEGMFFCKIMFKVNDKPVSATYENAGQVVLKK